MDGMAWARGADRYRECGIPITQLHKLFRWIIAFRGLEESIQSCVWRCPGRPALPTGMDSMFNYAVHSRPLYDSGADSSHLACLDCRAEQEPEQPSLLHTYRHYLDVVGEPGRVDAVDAVGL